MTRVSEQKTRADVISEIKAAQAKAEEARQAIIEQTEIIRKVPPLGRAVELLGRSMGWNNAFLIGIEPTILGYHANKGEVGQLLVTFQPEEVALGRGVLDKHGIQYYGAKGFKDVNRSGAVGFVVDPTQPQFFEKVAAAYGEYQAIGDSKDKKVGTAAMEEKIRRFTAEATKEIWGDIPEHAR